VEGTLSISLLSIRPPSRTLHKRVLLSPSGRRANPFHPLTVTSEEPGGQCGGQTLVSKSRAMEQATPATLASAVPRTHGSLGQRSPR